MDEEKEIPTSEEKIEPTKNDLPKHPVEIVKMRKNGGK